MVFTERVRLSGQFLVSRFSLRRSMGTVVLFLVFIASPAISQNAQPASDGLSVLPDGQRQQVDDSVRRALAWIADQQEVDGSFPTQAIAQPGVTSLCIMAFLAAGHLPGEGPYGDTIERGIAYVISCQKPNGLIASIAPLDHMEAHTSSHTAMYNHAISGLLLSEAFGMTGASAEGKLRESIEQAIKFTLDRQNNPRKRIPMDQGGWRYPYYWSGSDSDLSITSWHLLFLRSARNSGFEVGSQPIDDAMGYVKRLFDPDRKTFMYGSQGQDRAINPAMAGAGILALSLGGFHDSEMARMSGDWLLRRHPFRYYPTSGNYRSWGERYFYAFFYDCQAMRQIGGQHWSEFFPESCNTFIRNQHPDGSWDPEPGEDRIYGNVYTTALVVLGLTTPYQLLPIYQR